MSEGLDFQNLDETLIRLDDLIEQEQDVEKMRAGLGMRLALSMAQELQAGKPLGSDTAVLVTEWSERFGQDTVDAAVGIARAFLIRPEDLIKDLGTRLGLKTKIEPRPYDIEDEA